MVINEVDVDSKDFLIATGTDSGKSVTSDEGRDLGYMNTSAGLPSLTSDAEDLMAQKETNSLQDGHEERNPMLQVAES
ncbi:hypothetical protein [Pseudomonas sp. FW305-BF6]|uniref:hypothetical protein n=1 Tax=Pseudomonas sp. FW305-BF6 TaxID=2070673 RepID=UPI001304F968